LKKLALLNQEAEKNIEINEFFEKEKKHFAKVFFIEMAAIYFEGRKTFLVH
jgi:hypothetical protein